MNKQQQAGLGNDRVCLSRGTDLNNSRLLEEERHDESSAPKSSELPSISAPDENEDCCTHFF